MAPVEIGYPSILLANPIAKRTAPRERVCIYLQSPNVLRVGPRDPRDAQGCALGRVCVPCPEHSCGHTWVSVPCSLLGGLRWHRSPPWSLWEPLSYRWEPHGAFGCPFGALGSPFGTFGCPFGSPLEPFVVRVPPSPSLSLSEAIAELIYEPIPPPCPVVHH